MEGTDTSPGEADNISPQEIYEPLKRSLLKHPAAEGIYLLGSGAWRVVDVVPVEEDLEVPVVQPATGRIAEVAAIVDKTLRHSLFIRRIQNPLNG